jgi:hypothetical protein
VVNPVAVLEDLEGIRRDHGQGPVDVADPFEDPPAPAVVRAVVLGSLVVVLEYLVNVPQG